jgi:membrane-associated phospholipid phosphatase
VTLVILGAYIAAALAASALHGDWLAAGVYAVLLPLVFEAYRSRLPTEWLPWLALPVLYWSAPATLFGPMHDATVQGWDVTLFHAQPARDLAAALPWRPLSEILHLAYLSYYIVIYLPPVALWFIIRDREGFARLTLAFTLAMVFSFIGFALFPVQGPRYEWGASSFVPPGAFRHFTLFLLERGSAHGTAFPSSHVAISVTQSLVTLHSHRALGVWVSLTTLLLSIGAVYGGFHYASDVLAGAAVAVISVVISRRFLPEMPR